MENADTTRKPEQGDKTGRNRSSVLKSSLVMSGGTLVSRVFGLFREQVQGFYLGTGTGADAFGIAATIPNLLRRLFAEGAMTAAFVPVFTDHVVIRDRERINAFYSGFMTLFILLMLAVTLLGIVFAEPLVRHVFAARFADVPGKVELTVGLTRLMFPYLLIISIAAIIQASLNTFRIFGPSAYTPVLLSVSIILAVVLFHRYFPDPSWALATGFVVGGVFQLLFQIPFLRKQGVRFRPSFAGLRDGAVRQVGRLFLPGILGAGVYQINTAVAQIIATTLDPGTVASLHYSLRLQELVLGIFAVSVSQVLLPNMSELVSRGDRDGVRDTLEFSIGLMALVTIPATAGLVILGEPIIRLLFQYGRFGEESVSLTVWALYFHSAGIFFIALYRNASQVFFAFKDTRTPVVVSVISMVINVAMCLLLSGPLKNGGIAAAGSIAALVSVVIMLVLLRPRTGPLQTSRILKSVVRVLLATAVMSAVLLVLRFNLRLFEIEDYLSMGIASRALNMGWRVLLAVVLAILVYGAVARFFRIPELMEMWQMVRRRLKR